MNRSWLLISLLFSLDVVGSPLGGGGVQGGVQGPTLQARPRAAFTIRWRSTILHVPFRSKSAFVQTTVPGAWFTAICTSTMFTTPSPLRSRGELAPACRAIEKSPDSAAKASVPSLCYSYEGSGWYNR
jgi:hypothetical protein